MLFRGAHEFGGSDAATSIGVALGVPPEQSVAYANERAAELIGKKWIDGQLVENPNPQFAITETVRQDIKATVSQAITEGASPKKLASQLQDTMGAWRAETIARTETAMAYNAGAADVYESSEVEHVQILDGDFPEGSKIAVEPRPSGDALRFRRA